MKRHNNKILFGIITAIGLAILIISGFFLFSRTSSQQAAAPKKQETELSSPAQQDSPAPVRQVQTSPQEYGQNLYRIITAKYESASLTEQFPFIAELLSTHHDDAGEVLSAYPSIIDVADMVIPAKKLRLVGIYTQSPDNCERGYCPFDIYVQKSGKWEGVLSMVVSTNQYLLVDDSSVSLILCSQYSKGYERYRLADGRLEKPITITDGEYFAFAGAFKHDKIASCP